MSSYKDRLRWSTDNHPAKAPQTEADRGRIDSYEDDWADSFTHPGQGYQGMSRRMDGLLEKGLSNPQTNWDMRRENRDEEESLLNAAHGLLTVASIALAASKDPRAKAAREAKADLNDLTGGRQVKGTKYHGSAIYNDNMHRAAQETEELGKRAMGRYGKYYRIRGSAEGAPRSITQVRNGKALVADLPGRVRPASTRYADIGSWAQEKIDDSPMWDINDVRSNWRRLDDRVKRLNRPKPYSWMDETRNTEILTELGVLAADATKPQAEKEEIMDKVLGTASYLDLVMASYDALKGNYPAAVINALDWAVTKRLQAVKGRRLDNDVATERFFPKSMESQSYYQKPEEGNVVR